MRKPERIPIILKEIEKVWKKYPDLRLGQLLEGAVIKEKQIEIYISPDLKPFDLFYIEDEELIKCVEKF